MSRKRSLGHNPLGETSKDVSLKQLVTPEEELPPGEVAIALFGRGSEAAAEVGVIAALLAGDSPATGSQALLPTRILGSGFGAFDAALLAARWDQGAEAAIERLERIWRHRIAASPNGVYRLRGDPTELMNPVRVARHPLDAVRHLADDGVYFARDWLLRGVDFARSSSQLSHRMLNLADLTTLVSTEPLAELLEGTLSSADFAASPLSFEILATGWSSGETHRFGPEDLDSAEGLELLRGAISLPGIFPAVEVRGESWTDGSLDPDPLAGLLAGEVETIHLVEPVVSPQGKSRRCSTLGALEQIARRRTSSALQGSLERIQRANQERGGRSITVHRYRPELETVASPSVLDFSKPRIAAAIREGRRNAASHDCRSAGCVLADRSLG